jgi:hypothetical protein
LYFCNRNKKEIVTKKIGDKTMKPEVGKHYVTTWLKSYAVQVWDSVSENGCCSGHTVAKFWSFEEAVREMYRLNGWKQPKTIYKRY